MRNRDFFLPSVTTLILFGLVWFLSCAHQNRWQDETGTQYDEMAQAESEEGTTELAVNETSQPVEEEPVQAENNWDEGSPQALTPEQQEQLKAELNQGEAPVENQEGSAAPSATEGDAAALAMAETPENTPAEPVETPEAVETAEPTPVAEESTEPKKVWVGRTPIIPSQAFSKKGTKLNRFYFVRKGDTPKKVSELIYSDSSFSKKLTSWNGKNWKPGKVLFYASPQNAGDQKMQSFYQERNIAPEEYRIKNGDWLTRIAYKKLGSVGSWKELAVVNGLKNPGEIEVNQVLAVYPKNLSAAPMVAQQEYESPERPAESIPQMQVPQEAPRAQAPQPRVEQPQAPTQPMEAPSAGLETPEPETQEASSPSASGTNWDQVVEQNSVAIFIGLTLIVLFLALSARKKRAKARAQASGSDGPENYTENTTAGRFGKRR